MTEACCIIPLSQEFCRLTFGKLEHPEQDRSKVRPIIPVSAVFNEHASTASVHAMPLFIIKASCSSALGIDQNLEQP